MIDATTSWSESLMWVAVYTAVAAILIVIIDEWRRR
jgi:hypothetical protein